MCVRAIVRKSFTNAICFYRALDRGNVKEEGSILAHGPGDAVYHVGEGGGSGSTRQLLTMVRHQSSVQSGFLA